MSGVYGEELVLRFGGVRVDGTGSPSFHAAVERLCGKAGIAVSATYVVPGDELNAFTTGRGRDQSLIAVYAGMLRRASESELEAVIGHEIGHIVHGDVQHKTRVALGCLAARMAGSAAGGILAGSIDDDDDLLTGGLKVLGGILVAAGTSAATDLYTTRKNFESEFRADAYAATLTGKPWALASVLEKLESPEGGEIPAEIAQLHFTPPLQGMIGVETHPSTPERMSRALEIPAAFPPEGEAAATEYCVGCGTRLAPGRLRCGACGAIRGGERRCAACGEPRSPTDDFCIHCGARHG